MHEKIFDIIDERYLTCNNYTEENIKAKVVVKVLEYLGYNPDNFDYEHNEYHRDKFVDIAILMEDDILYVEVKRGDKQIEEKDIAQLSSYLCHKNIEWGIITNGKRYILINSRIKINGTYENIVNNRIVLDEEKPIRGMQKSYIKYLSKDSIFINRTINYFRDVAQFKALKYPNIKDNNQSWKQYRSTLYNFFEYLIELHDDYRGLNNIDFNNYSDFWKHIVWNKTKGQSFNKCKNKYRHLSSLIKTLNKEKIITNVVFEYNVKTKLQKLYNMTVVEVDKEPFVLNNIMVEKALNILNKKRNSLRNTTIFLLSIYCGIQRSDIINLKDNNFKADTLLIQNRQIKLPPIIVKNVEKILQEKKKKKIKVNTLFFSKYNNKYVDINEYAIMNIYNIIKKETDWDNCCIEKIATNLIPQLFKNGYSIESIAYMTGKSLSNLERFIPYDEMVDYLGKANKNIYKQHPFSEVLEL